MKPKVWSEARLHPDALARLQAKAEVITPATPDNLAGAEAAIIGGAVVDDAFIERAGPQLKLVVRHGIGYDKVDVAATTRHGVLAANTPDGPTESTAEHAVALMMAIAKRVAKADRILHNKEPYTSADLRGTEVLDHVLGIVGFGRIGRRVAEICGLGLRMKLVVYDPLLPNDVKLGENIQMVGSLDELLAQADFVTLHTPLTPDTKHLIGKRELDLMKPDAYLINASRGPIVDEAALIRALESGRLAGAGLDVFEIEPPDPDNPLLHMDNVVVSPHVASNTLQGTFRMSSNAVDQVLQVLAGERPDHLIDPAAWPGRMGSAHSSHASTSYQPV